MLFRSVMLFGLSSGSAAVTRLLNFLSSRNNDMHIVAAF